VLCVSALAAGAAEPPAVRWIDGRITADLRDVPRDEAVAALARATGVVFRGDLHDRDAVQARLRGASFREAVARVVGGQNFTIVYDAGGHPRRVDLWGMPRVPTRTPARPASAPQGFATLVTRHPPVDLPPVLAQALGMPRSGLPWVLRGGLRHHDPAVAAAAAALFVRQVARDPSLRGAFLRADDRRLRTVLGTWAGTALAKLVHALVAQAPDPAMRHRAQRLERHLAGGTEPASPPT
jgi:hypothetical protein